MHPVGPKALIVGSAPVAPRNLLPGAVFDAVDLVIAADAGFAACGRLGLRPDLAVGDFDSAGAADLARLDASGIPVVRVPAEKDESDLELALVEAVQRGARTVVVLGALGGPRIEHELSAIELLGHAADLGVEMWLIDDRSAIRLLDAGRDPDADRDRDADRDPDAGDSPDTGRDAGVRSHPTPGPGIRSVVEGSPGDFVSLFPFAGDAQGVTTDGLRYPLHDEDLPVGPSRGLSNELLGTRGEVELRRGRLLIVHTWRSGAPSPGQPSERERSRDP